MTKSEEDEMERQLITGIAYDRNEAKVTLTDGAGPAPQVVAHRSSARSRMPASTST